MSYIGHLPVHSFLLILFVVATQAEQWTPGFYLDRYLPLLGTSNAGLPRVIRSRGFWDPRAQILCTGFWPTDDTVPRQFLSLDEDLSAERPTFREVYGSSLRSLCAKTAYGGSTRAWNAGGYCVSTTNPPTILFEQLPPADGLDDEVVQKLYIMCQQSCRCVDLDAEEPLPTAADQDPQPDEDDPVPANDSGVNDGDDPDDPLADLVRSRVAPSILADEARLRNVVGPLVPIPPESPIWDPIPARPSLSTTEPVSDSRKNHAHIAVYFLPETRARRLGPTGRIEEVDGATTMWLAAPAMYWSPNCPDRRPRYPWDDRGTSTQSLCAATWFSGDPRGNAGFACRNTGPTSANSMPKAWENFVAHPKYRGNSRFLLGMGTDVLLEYSACIKSCECETFSNGMKDEGGWLLDRP